MVSVARLLSPSILLLVFPCLFSSRTGRDLLRGCVVVSIVGRIRLTLCLDGIQVRVQIVGRHGGFPCRGHHRRMYLNICRTSGLLSTQMIEGRILGFRHRRGFGSGLGNIRSTPRVHHILRGRRNILHNDLTIGSNAGNRRGRRSHLNLRQQNIQCPTRQPRRFRRWSAIWTRAKRGGSC